MVVYILHMPVRLRFGMTVSVCKLPVTLYYHLTDTKKGEM